MSALGFVDPITDAICTLHIRHGVATVEHPRCDQAADVAVPFDSFYCPSCGWNGRVSGAWVAHMIDRLAEPCQRCDHVRDAHRPSCYDDRQGECSCEAFVEPGTLGDVVCRHGDLVELCIDCTVAPPNPTAVPPARGEYPFTALFHGRCSGCDDAIETGQQIAGMTDGTYRHVICVVEWVTHG